MIKSAKVFLRGCLPEIRDEQRVFGEPSARQKKAAGAKKRLPSKQVKADDLLDLMGGGEPDLPTQPNGTQNNSNLLADILGGDTTSPPPQSQPSHSSAQDIMGLFGSNSAQTSSSAPQQQSSGLDDLLGGGGGGPSAPSPNASTTTHQAYNNNGISLSLQVQRSAGGAQILARFRNESNFDRFTGLQLQAAVPKGQRLQLIPISKTEIDGGEDATQQMKVLASTGVSWALIFAWILR